MIAQISPCIEVGYEMSLGMKEMAEVLPEERVAVFIRELGNRMKQVLLEIDLSQHVHHFCAVARDHCQLAQKYYGSSFIDNADCRQSYLKGSAWEGLAQVGIQKALESMPPTGWSVMKGDPKRDIVAISGGIMRFAGGGLNVILEPRSQNARFEESVELDVLLRHKESRQCMIMDAVAGFTGLCSKFVEGDPVRKLCAQAEQLLGERADVCFLSVVEESRKVALLQSQFAGRARTHFIYCSPPAETIPALIRFMDAILIDPDTPTEQLAPKLQALLSQGRNAAAKCMAVSAPVPHLRPQGFRSRSHLSGNEGRSKPR